MFFLAPVISAASFTACFNGNSRSSSSSTRGEFVLLVEGCVEDSAQPEDDSPRVLELLLRELPLKQAVKLAAEITGARKNTLYHRALELKKE